MTKADIVETVYEKVGGFSKKEAAEIVETVFDTVKETWKRARRSRSRVSGTSWSGTRTRALVATRRPAKRSRSVPGAS
jgi:hypothetical protein